MKVVFISNIFNKHVEPMCDVFALTPGISFNFIASANIKNGMRQITDTLSSKKDYVIQSWQSDEAFKRAKKLLAEADVIIAGSENRKLLPKNLKNKIFFRYSERIFKKEKWKFLRGVKNHFRFIKESRRGAYLLCASAYSKEDFEYCHLFKSHFIRWGYFPNGNTLLDLTNKQIGKDGFLNILWSGRMVPMKRPLDVVDGLCELRKQGISFRCTFIGDGKERSLVEESIKAKGLEDSTTFLGFIPNAKNLVLMKNADVIFFTSDRNEGWGATLNEAMSSKVVVIASNAAGSTPFLIQDGVNGYSYSTHEEMLEKVKMLCDFKKNQSIAEAAKLSIENEWNSSTAVKNLLILVDSINKKKNIPEILLAGKGPGTFIV